ncbi:MAG: hypothetical protein U1F09_09105 [Steroidobacteraceae bacterium]
MTDAVIAGAKAGAVTGLMGGLVPFVAGLFAREFKKGLVGLAICVPLGALFGMYAVIPASVGSLISIMRARSQREEALGGNGLSFRYGPVFAVASLVSLPIAGLLAIFVLGLAVIGIVSPKSSPSLKMSAVFLGFIGVAAGYVVLLGIRQWYVPLTQYTVTNEGVTTTFRSSTVFHPWSALSGAKHRTFMKQVELEFEGNARPVVLGNVDFPPQQGKVLRALALIEGATGRPVIRTKF